MATVERRKQGDAEARKRATQANGARANGAATAADAVLPLEQIPLFVYGLCCPVLA